MTTTGRQEFVTVTSSPARRVRAMVRYAAAAICGGVAVFYLAYFFVVNDREQAAVAHTESMAPVYLLGAALFLVGAVLLLVTDRAVLWAVGAIVPLLAVALYLWNGVHGVWDDPVAGALVSAAEVVLLLLLVSLAVSPPTGVASRS